MNIDKIRGCVFGLAIGDAIGLRYENAKPKDINSDNIGKVCFGGSISDDTEQMVLISKSLLSTNNINDFKTDFQNELKKWLLSLPINIGKTTLKSIFKSFFQSGYGVYGTGNGSVMRIAPIGLLYFNNQDLINNYAETSCRITHNSKEAVINSVAIASLIGYIIKNNLNKEIALNIEDILLFLKNISQEDFWIESIDEITIALKNNIPPLELVHSWTNTLGAIGYTKYSTLLSIYCWILYYGDYEKTIYEVIKCGGDTDTNAAIAGALAGATVGYQNIPQKLILKVNDIIIKRRDLDYLATCLSSQNGIIKTWKIHYFGFIKNIFSLFYFSLLISKSKILSIFKIKY